MTSLFQTMYEEFNVWGILLCFHSFSRLFLSPFLSLYISLSFTLSFFLSLSRFISFLLSLSPFSVFFLSLFYFTSLYLSLFSISLFHKATLFLSLRMSLLWKICVGKNWEECERISLFGHIIIIFLANSVLNSNNTRGRCYKHFCTPSLGV